VLAAQDAVEMAGEVAVAKEVVAEVTVQPWCLGRHQRLVPVLSGWIASDLLLDFERER